jgi:hypothetical protein
MVNEIICTTCPKDPDCSSVSPTTLNGSSPVGAATETINSLALEICASVAQYTGASVAKRQIDPLQPLWCYTLLFPLFVAGQALAAESPLRQWIIKELHSMAEGFGIQNGEVVAKLLEQGEKTSPWEVHALLGSYAFAA